ncbi:hypothetical protein D3C81_1759520 [compost metagenome]
MVADRFDGFFTDATGWNVDYPLQRRIVATTFKQTQIGHGVLDFGTFEEALATINAVGNALTQQGFFENARLGVGAVQNRDIAAG